MDAESRMWAEGPAGWAAWVEAAGDVDVLVIARGGEVTVRRALSRRDTRDFGYEGCQARFLGWFGGQVVVVAGERDWYLRCVDPESGEQTGLAMTWSWTVTEDRILWVDQEPGLILSASLPSLAAAPPIPRRGAAAPGEVRLGGYLVESLPLEPAGAVTDEERVAAELFPDGVTRAGRIFLESVLLPFGVRDYRERNWEPPAAWMIAYWHRHLVAQGRLAEAAEVVAMLDQVAAGAGTGSTAAVRHARYRAEVLTGVCRTGRLPAGWWCLLFDPSPRGGGPGSRVDCTRYPQTLREAFLEVAATAPAALLES